MPGVGWHRCSIRFVVILRTTTFESRNLFHTTMDLIKIRGNPALPGNHGPPLASMLIILEM
jgi:hypothetical protein